MAHGPEELELQKGEGVRVFGKEQDGWLRGMSLVTGRVGVFPSNYVAPLFRSGFSYTGAWDGCGYRGWMWVQGRDGWVRGRDGGRGAGDGWMDGWAQGALLPGQLESLDPHSDSPALQSGAHQPLPP